MVHYEWDVEILTACESEQYEENEVLDHHFQDSFADCIKELAQPLEEGLRRAVVLVCDDDNGRSWAYLEDGKLPEYFVDAYQNQARKVPQKFHKEVSNNKYDVK
jgi:hypothetical protein